VSDIPLVLRAALGAILGAAGSGYAKYKAAMIGFKRQQIQKQLFTALQDLQCGVGVQRACVAALH